MTCLALNSLRALAAGRDELRAGLLEIFLLDELGHRVCCTRRARGTRGVILYRGYPANVGALG